VFCAWAEPKAANIAKAAVVLMKLRLIIKKTPRRW
jgi:hypothetical protein